MTDAPAPARPRTVARAAVSGGLLLVLSAAAVALAAPASAHVSVNPREAPAGGFQKLSLRVPNESPSAGTVAVSLDLPTDTPLASVSVRPHAGWRADVTRTTLPEPVTSGDLEITQAVTRITWTAERGVRVGPGQFEEFDIAVGPLPEDVGTLTFPATQTYDDGQVVHWDEPVDETGEEPEHPAPLLTLTAAEHAGHAGGAATVTPVSTGTTTTAAPATDTTARLLGAGGLAVGVLGAGSAVATTVAARRRRQV